MNVELNNLNNSLSVKLPINLVTLLQCSLTLENNKPTFKVYNGMLWSHYGCFNQFT